MAEREEGIAVRRPNERGFTLIEIGIVLLIIAIAVGFIVPRLRDRSYAELQSSARRLATTLRFVRDEAVIRGREYVVTIDLEQQTYSVSFKSSGTAPDTDDEVEATENEEVAERLDQEAAYESADGPIARTVTLVPPIGIADVVLPADGVILHEGRVSIGFYPDGTSDLAVVHLHNGLDAYTLKTNPWTGLIYLVRGYIPVS